MWTLSSSSLWSERLMPEDFPAGLSTRHYLLDRNQHPKWLCGWNPLASPHELLSAPGDTGQPVMRKRIRVRIFDTSAPERISFHRDLDLELVTPIPSEASVHALITASGWLLLLYPLQFFPVMIWQLSAIQPARLEQLFLKHHSPGDQPATLSADWSRDFSSTSNVRSPVLIPGLWSCFPDWVCEYDHSLHSFRLLSNDSPVAEFPSAKNPAWLEIIPVLNLALFPLETPVSSSIEKEESHRVQVYHLETRQIIHQFDLTPQGGNEFWRERCGFFLDLEASASQPPLYLTKTLPFGFRVFLLRDHLGQWVRSSCDIPSFEITLNDDQNFKRDPAPKVKWNLHFTREALWVSCCEQPPQNQPSILIAHPLRLWRLPRFLEKQGPGELLQIRPVEIPRLFLSIIFLRVFDDRVLLIDQFRILTCHPLVPGAQ